MKLMGWEKLQKFEFGTQRICMLTMLLFAFVYLYCFFCIFVFVFVYLVMIMLLRRGGVHVGGVGELGEHCSINSSHYHHIYDYHHHHS